MSRDELKSIIERGRQIPETKSHITTPIKNTKKQVQAALDQQPKLRTALNSHRTLRGTRL